MSTQQKKGRKGERKDCEDMRPDFRTHLCVDSCLLLHKLWETSHRLVFCYTRVSLKHRKPVCKCFALLQIYLSRNLCWMQEARIIYFPKTKSCCPSNVFQKAEMNSQAGSEIKLSLSTGLSWPVGTQEEHQQSEYTLVCNTTVQDLCIRDSRLES